VRAEGWKVSESTDVTPEISGATEFDPFVEHIFGDVLSIHAHVIAGYKPLPLFFCVEIFVFSVIDGLLAKSMPRSVKEPSNGPPKSSILVSFFFLPMCMLFVPLRFDVNNLHCLNTTSYHVNLHWSPDELCSIQVYVKCISLPQNLNEVRFGLDSVVMQAVNVVVTFVVYPHTPRLDIDPPIFRKIDYARSVELFQLAIG